MEGKGTGVPFFVALDAYVKKGVGIDMVMKSLLGIFRIMATHTSDPGMSGNYADVAQKIVNCRMLANHFRHFMSLSTAMTIFEKEEGSFLSWFSMFLSFLFRSLEQVFGDLNYYQMTIMHQWSRARLTFGYHFFKSLSLTCGLINELTHIKRIVRLRGAARLAAVKASFISIVRYLCDMAVYYQWLPFYNPPKTAQYAFGSMAGILGVYVVWNDTRDALVARQTPPATSPIATTPVVCKKRNSVSEERRAQTTGSKGGNCVDNHNTVEPIANETVTKEEEIAPKESVTAAATAIEENARAISDAERFACAHTNTNSNTNTNAKNNVPPVRRSAENGSAKARGFARAENGRRSGERNAPTVGAE